MVERGGEFEAHEGESVRGFVASKRTWRKCCILG